MNGSPDTPRLWIKVDLGARGQIGPGKIALLRAIREHRSIAAAARAMGMSYRRAWLLVDEIGRTLGRPVVDTHVGGARRGGAVLTDPGDRLIACYDRLLAHAQDGSAAALDALADLVAPGE